MVVASGTVLTAMTLFGLTMVHTSSLLSVSEPPLPAEMLDGEGLGKVNKFKKIRKKTNKKNNNKEKKKKKNEKDTKQED